MTSAISQLVYMPNFRAIGQSVWEKSGNRQKHRNTERQTETQTDLNFIKILAESTRYSRLQKRKWRKLWNFHILQYFYAKFSNICPDFRQKKIEIKKSGSTMTSAISQSVYMPKFRAIGQSVWEKSGNRQTDRNTETQKDRKTDTLEIYEDRWISLNFHM